MEVKNLLEFLNKTKNIQALEYAVCSSKLVNFLDIIDEDAEFTRKIDLGVIFIYEVSPEKCIIIDGLSRLLSLSLLLHAICECYKKTSERNDKAITTIRKKYLLNNTKTKLRLPKDLQVIYDKIIYGERLSGREKEHPMFVLLHNYWQVIKDNRLKASNIFEMLQKIVITSVDADNMEYRDLYYALNHSYKNLNQIMLITDYLKLPKTKNSWKEIKEIYQNKDSDLILFFKDFFLYKFNYKEFKEDKLYEYFVNYFETMLQYSKPDVVMSKLKNSAHLYHQLITANIPEEELKKAIIQLKLHNCDDTYAYLLGVYEDYADGTISLSTFLEIIATIKEYIENRKETENKVSFNELIQYLNAFIAYK